MSSKIDFSNPVVIVVAIGALWMLASSGKAQSRAIVPTVAGTAPKNNTLSTLVSGLGSIFGGAASNTAKTSAGRLFDSLTGGISYENTAAEVARQNGSDDGFNILFGGYSPKWNSDNIGGSSFDGGLSIGTGSGLW
jgi:hypothetical protein